MTGKEHQTQITSKNLVAANTFIVIEKVAAAIKDKLTFIDFQALDMMGRMAGMRQHLIDPSAQHDIANQEKGDALSRLRHPIVHFCSFLKFPAQPPFCR